MKRSKWQSIASYFALNMAILLVYSFSLPAYAGFHFQQETISGTVVDNVSIAPFPA